MCVSAAGAAEFKDTEIVLTEGLDENYDLWHTLCYLNQMQNLNASGPGCMWIHVPSAEPLGESNLMYVPEWVLTGIRLSLKPIAKDLYSGTRAGAVIVEYGPYHVVLAENASAAKEVLPGIPTAKRPRINPAMYPWYDAMFPGWGVALFCFNNKDLRKAEPVWIRYKPMADRAGRIHAPAVDAHNGGLPELKMKVQRGHGLYICSAYRPLRGMSAVFYERDLPTELVPFLPQWGAYFEMPSEGFNGDWEAPMNDTELVGPQLMMPPGYRG